MPHPSRSFLLASAFVLLLSQSGRADYQLVFTASDLTSGQSSSGGMIAVNPGDTVEFTVGLSGLEANQTLDFLEADLSVPDTTVVATSTPSFGTIIPTATGFFASPNPVSAFYDDTLADTMTPISTNGSFFTFTAKIDPLATGTDTVSITFASSISDGGGTPIPFTNLPSLLVNVSPVPEPSSFLLALLGGGVLMARFGRRVARR